MEPDEEDDDGGEDQMAMVCVVKVSPHYNPGTAPFSDTPRGYKRNKCNGESAQDGHALECPIPQTPSPAEMKALLNLIDDLAESPERAIRLADFLEAHRARTNLSYNAKRKAIQVFGCTGTVLVNAQLSAIEAAALEEALAISGPRAP